MDAVSYDDDLVLVEAEQSRHGLVRFPKSAIVVGAGVSGCVCAAALAEQGVEVTLVNSAMDRVGMPAYGPDIRAASEEPQRAGALEEILAGLPYPLNNVWLDAALAPTHGGAVLNVDRRRVSIETKRLLEAVPGVQFRQGFVVDVGVDGRNQASSRPRVETVFGEVLEADVVVLAVGLSLGAETAVGMDVVPGGRYGEPASEGLSAALLLLGATLGERVVEMGASFNSHDLAPHGGREAEVLGADANRERLRLDALTSLRAGVQEDIWPEGFPPAPHVDDGLRLRWMLFAADPLREGQGTGWAPAVSPDGAATGEVYAAPDGGGAGDEGARPVLADGLLPSRVSCTVHAFVVEGLGVYGRLELPSGPVPIWCIGRCAGASDYRESLLSGLQAARDITESLGGLA